MCWNRLDMKLCIFNIWNLFFYTSIVVASCYVVLLYRYHILFNNEWLPSYFSSSMKNHDRRSGFGDEHDGSLPLNTPLSNFDQHWIDWNKWRFDYGRFQRACSEFKWVESEGVPWFELANHTDPTRGVVQEMEIRRAGEFSRFVLRTQNSKG